MFVFWKVVSGKPLSCVCLPLENVVNEKHFPVNRKHFSVNGKHFPVKGKFDLVSRKVFSLLAVFVFRKVVSGKSLSKLSCVCLPLEKVVNRNTFQLKENLAWFSGKCFPGKFGRKTLSGSCEKFRNVIICCYIKFDPQNFDCYIYFVLNIYFLISSLKI